MMPTLTALRWDGQRRNYIVIYLLDIFVRFRPRQYRPVETCWDREAKIEPGDVRFCVYWQYDHNRDGNQLIGFLLFSISLSLLDWNCSNNSRLPERDPRQNNEYFSSENLFLGGKNHYALLQDTDKFLKRFILQILLIGLDNHFRSVNLDKKPNKAYFSTSVNNVMRLSVERKIWIRIIIHEVQARNCSGSSWLETLRRSRSISMRYFNRWYN